MHVNSLFEQPPWIYPYRRSSKLGKKRVQLDLRLHTSTRAFLMRSKSSPTRRVSTSTDNAINALREEFIRGFREESASVASEFRERVSPYSVGALGAAYVLGLRPGRWKWSGVYFNEPASWRQGCRECLDHWCSAFTGKLKVFVADLCELGYSIDTVGSRLCSPNSSCVWDCVAYVCGGCGMSLSSSTWQPRLKISSD